MSKDSQIIINDIKSLFNGFIKIGRPLSIDDEYNKYLINGLADNTIDKILINPHEKAKITTEMLQAQRLLNMEIQSLMRRNFDSMIAISHIHCLTILDSNYTLIQTLLNKL